MPKKPRKFPTKRKQERRQREKPDLGTPEQLKRFRLLVGRKKSSPKDNADENPVRVLHARGYLDDMQETALIEFGNLFWGYTDEFTRRPKATMEGRQLAGNGSVSMPNDYNDERSEAREANYKRLDDLLTKKGKAVRNITRNVALTLICDENNLHDGFPKFFVRQYVWEKRGKEYQMDRVEKNELAMLRAGADALLGR